MSLSVSNTGYSNSQAQSTAIPSATAQSTTTESTTTDSVQIVDPITGKTVTLPNNIKISAEAMTRLKETIATAPSLTPGKEAQTKEPVDIYADRNLIRQTDTSKPYVSNEFMTIYIDEMGSNEIAIENWSGHLKADSGISKEEFLGLVKKALSSPPDVSLWSYTTDSIEITLTANKLETLKNRYVDSDYQKRADLDIQDFVEYKSNALSNLEKNILQDEYQRSVDAGDTDKANSTFLELQKNAEGTSTTQLQRQQIFSRAASTDVSTWFGNFRDYIAASDFDRYTKSEYNSIVSEFYNHWLGFQLALK
ncbi:hypothetical protein [Pectobacterium zantedeschiae]|uniref:Uncharacterized protein n=1 Tax=Pectobacterium zantedeschiae TaxID=2034769 RepID=A0A9X8JLJ5_9GAMM|nr:hypothetical protein [Pectobacterium zantedeschiae]RYC37429.1 hypothetical protein CTN06_21260 [Pectobacterium zantedeschiae]RYC45916.1 hypothetical protein CLR69_13430 [Pectobacterium zantedeschiae]RYC47028.1 hypothetical protein DEH81_01165 [Pectobacterium zantedeschiae]